MKTAKGSVADRNCVTVVRLRRRQVVAVIDEWGNNTFHV